MTWKSHLKSCFERARKGNVQIGQSKATRIKKVARALHAVIFPKRFSLLVRVEKARNDPLGVLADKSNWGIFDPILVPKYPAIIAIRNSIDIDFMLCVLVHEMGHYEQACMGIYFPRRRNFEEDATSLGCKQLLQSGLDTEEKTKISAAGIKAGFHKSIWNKTLEELK